LSKITPTQVSEAIRDSAAGGMLIPGETRDEFLAAFGKRITGRVAVDDPRLEPFAAYTDPSGYVWIPRPALEWRDTAVTEKWSFERCFTALADAVRALPALSSDELENLAQEVDQIERIASAGFRPTRVEYDRESQRGGIIFVRDEERRVPRVHPPPRDLGSDPFHRRP
jgi:hypothetical protein